MVNQQDTIDHIPFCMVCEERANLCVCDGGPQVYVCPGCYAVGDQPCAPGCIDAEIEREREERELYGDPSERYDSGEDDA